MVGFPINLPSVSLRGMERRTRRSEERVDKKAIVSVRVSEVACPEGSPRRRSQCKRGRLHRRAARHGGMVPALMLALAASTGTQGTDISSNDNGSGS